MKFRLISHVTSDDDLIEAWLQHYLKLGVASFHLIAHGGREQNQRLFEIVDRYPIQILDTYRGVFDPFEKRDRLAWGLATFARVGRARGQRRIPGAARSVTFRHR